MTYWLSLHSPARQCGMNEDRRQSLHQERLYFSWWGGRIWSNYPQRSSQRSCPEMEEEHLLPSVLIRQGFGVALTKRVFLQEVMPRCSFLFSLLLSLPHLSKGYRPCGRRTVFAICFLSLFFLVPCLSEGSRPAVPSSLSLCSHQGLIYGWEMFGFSINRGELTNLGLDGSSSLWIKPWSNSRLSGENSVSLCVYIHIYIYIQTHHVCIGLSRLVQW